MAADPPANYWETEMKARDYNYAAGYKAGLLDGIQAVRSLPRAKCGFYPAIVHRAVSILRIDRLIAHVQATGTLEGE